MKLLRARGLLPALIVMLLLAGSVAGALAVNDNLGSLGGVHWARNKNPFTLEVGNNVRGKWNRYLDKAVDQWNRSNVVRFKVVSGNTSPSRCNETKGRVEVCSADYGDTRWLGLTRLYYDKSDPDHITAATMKLNDFYFNQRKGKYNNKDARRHTMCHELGHTIGLEHVNSRGCMNDSEQAIQDNLKPIKKDFKTLRKLYKHKDRGRSTVGRAATGARAAEGTGFIEIESPIYRDGRRTTTTEFLPDGSRVVTTVTWAGE